MFVSCDFGGGGMDCSTSEPTFVSLVGRTPVFIVRTAKVPKLWSGGCLKPTKQMPIPRLVIEGHTQSEAVSNSV